MDVPIEDIMALIEAARDFENNLRRRN